MASLLVLHLISHSILSLSFVYVVSGAICWKLYVLNMKMYVLNMSILYFMLSFYLSVIYCTEAWGGFYYVVHLHLTRVLSSE